MQEIVVIDGEITLENTLDGEVELEAITDLDPEVVIGTGGAVYPHYTGSYSTAAGEVLGKDMKELGFEVTKKAIEVQTRKVKTPFTMEMYQDLKAQHGQLADEELINLASYELQAEIDRECVEAVNSWARVAPDSNIITGTDYKDMSGRWEIERYRAEAIRIDKEAVLIGQNVKNGNGGNTLIVSPKVAVMLRQLDGFALSPKFNQLDIPAAGGVAGFVLKQVMDSMQKGIARGIFSNEAGLGSAPIAHAAADVDHPVKQGIYGVFEVFMDTIVVCTMTALVVLLGVGVQNIEYGTDIGANLTIMGFQSVFGGALPGVAVAICLSLFALSTVLAWALYGTRCIEYLFGHKAVRVYQVIFCLFACIAGAVKLDLAWAIADTLNGLMAIPNLVGLAFLSPVVVKLTKEYFATVKANK